MISDNKIFLIVFIGFISDWLVFYHLGHEVAEDAKDYLSDLQLKVQKVMNCTSMIYSLNLNVFHIIFFSKIDKGKL